MQILLVVIPIASLTSKRVRQVARLSGCSITSDYMRIWVGTLNGSAWVLGIVPVLVIRLEGIPSLHCRTFERTLQKRG